MAQSHLPPMLLQDAIDFIAESKDAFVKAGLAIAIALLAFLAIKLLRRVVAQTAERHQIDLRRSHVVGKFGQAIIYLVAAAALSNVLGFGIEGIFVATSSFFALVGVAFFATWSILSNATASVILYFSFPYRIGDRLLIENEARFCGVLRDVTLFYLKLETPSGSTISIPANVAIQKIITVLSEEAYQRLIAEQGKETAEALSERAEAGTPAPALSAAAR